MKWTNSGFINDAGSVKILWLCPNCDEEVGGIGLNVPDEKSICPYCGWSEGKEAIKAMEEEKNALSNA